MKKLWDRLKGHTVWYAESDVAEDDRSGPRFWYPTYDLIAFALGVYALLLGSPLLNRLFPHWFTGVMGVFLMVVSVMCLIGVVFPKFELYELMGKLGIVFLLGGYAGTVAFMGRNTEPNGFVVLVLVMAVWLLGPRVTRLYIRVSRTRRARKLRME